MENYKFHYRSLEEIFDDLNKHGLALQQETDVSVLGTPCSKDDFRLVNRLGIAPMEGMDAQADGTPGELTTLRYTNFAKGGAGLIWFEAVSIVPEGRSSLKQLLLTKETLPAFQRLNEQMKEAGTRENGYAPLLIMQANHSGRYSRPNPNVAPEPIIAYHHPHLEKDNPISDERIATDDYLKNLEEQFGESARLAKEAGFDGIDIKSCHGYLLAELASAFTRPGPFGGSFENRFRLLMNGIKNAQVWQDKSFIVTTRLNIYDHFPYPYGFGMDKDGTLTPDYEEPIRLVKALREDLHMPYLNVTMGNPHVQPNITRPCLTDKKFPGSKPPEDPMINVVRHFDGAGAIKKAVPDILLSASAPSFLRQYSPEVSAALINQGYCDQVCFGRMAFANPAFANDILKEGRLDSKTVCVSCSKCSELLRGGKYNGCVVRNPGVYLQYYRELG